MLDIVVIWDIDGTVIDGSLERRFLDYLIKHGHVTPGSLVGSALRLATDFPPKWHKVKACYLRGKPVDRVAGLVDACWTESILPDVSRAAVDAVHQLRDLGATQLLQSGTLRPLADKMASHLGIADVIAADLEIRDDRYTGRLVKPHPIDERKMLYADEWLIERGLNWDNTVAIADHWGDRYMLERSDLAIVVCPMRQLRDMAKRMGWIVIENRDELHTTVEIIRNHVSDRETEIRDRLK
jgi:HAD superfamily phosphoserine phosphatase-like hydrolase